MFKKDVIPFIGTLPIKSVRRRDLVAILDTVHGRGSKRMTGQLLNELRLFVNHAVDRTIDVMRGGPEHGAMHMPAGACGHPLGSVARLHRRNKQLSETIRR